MESPSNFLWCPECGDVRPRRANQTPYSCLWCQKLDPVPQLRFFNRNTWEECNAPLALAQCVRSWRLITSERRIRLQACAFARCLLPQGRRFGLFSKAVEWGENWAETGTPPAGAEQTRRELIQRIQIQRIRAKSDDDWAYAASWCLGDSPSIDLGEPKPSHRNVLADTYREFFPNPFIGVRWNPDWFTSTVRDLAAHIYTSREFPVMPILADALQDAGCEDELILNHCRANKPHARGCWILDAILGKA